MLPPLQRPKEISTPQQTPPENYPNNLPMISFNNNHASTAREAVIKATELTPIRETRSKAKGKSKAINYTPESTPEPSGNDSENETPPPPSVANTHCRVARPGDIFLPDGRPLGRLAAELSILPLDKFEERIQYLGVLSDDELDDERVEAIKRMFEGEKTSARHVTTATLEVGVGKELVAEDGLSDGSKSAPTISSALCHEQEQPSLTPPTTLILTGSIQTNPVAASLIQPIDATLPVLAPFTPTLEGGPNRNPAGPKTVPRPHPVLKSNTATHVSSSSRKHSAPTEESNPTWYNTLKIHLLAGMEDLPAWVELVDAWFKLEQLHGFTKVGVGIPKTSDRPKVIDAWNKNGKVKNATLPKGTEGTLGKKTQKWWDDLNPAWRVRDLDGGLLQTGQGDWGSLHVHGPNGLLLVVACLRFWYFVGGSNVKDSEWLKLKNDVLWVLNKLTEDRVEDMGPPAKKMRST